MRRLIVIFYFFRERCLTLLASLALLVPEKELKLTDEVISKALSEFQKITDEAYDEDSLLEEIFTFDHTEPQFFIEWIYCQAWFLYLTESVWSASVFLDELLHKANYYEKNAPVYLFVNFNFNSFSFFSFFKFIYYYLQRHVLS